jgi:hypothetical protein
MTTSIDIALHIVTHPQNFMQSQECWASQWEQLKKARGQTVNRDRIGAPAYLIAPACNDESEAQIARISGKVRQIAHDKGIDLPPSAA